MARILSFVLIVCLGFFSTSLMAKTLKLNPNESKVITNKGFWTVNATCSVQTEKDTNRIRVSVLNNKGKVNGRDMVKGQTTSMSLRNNQSFSVSAEPGAKVNLVNLEDSTLKAICT